MEEEYYIAEAKKEFDAGDTWSAIYFINRGLTTHPGNTTLKILLDQYKAYEEKEDLMKRNTIEMRLKILTIEQDVYVPNPDEIKQNGHHLQKMINDFDEQLELAYTLKKYNNTKYLPEAEKLMCEIKKEVWDKKRVVTPKTEQAKAKTVEENVPDYRSIVTVKGTPEDVKQCIAKAQEAFEKGNLDKAERLLNKAERICPTKNARQLLKLVRAAAEAKVEQTSEQAEIQEPADEDNKEEYMKPEKERMQVAENIVLESQNVINARKCLKLTDEALKSGNLDKAVRMLEKAKRLDPDVNIDEKLDDIGNVIEKAKRDKEAKMREATERDRKAKMREAAKKERESNMRKDTDREREEANTVKATEREDKELAQVNQVIENDLQLACDFVHRAEKTYEEGRWADAEELLLKAKKMDESLDLGQDLHNVRAKLAEERSATANSKGMEHKKSNKCDQEICEDYLDRAQAAYDSGDLYDALRIFQEGKTRLPSFGWDPHMAYVLRAIQSSKSSTSGNEPIPRNETDNSIHVVETAKKNVKEAEVDYSSGRYHENVNALQNVYDVYPKTAIKKVLIMQKKPERPSHENTNSETNFSCLQDKMERNDFNERQKEAKNKTQKTNKARDDPCNVNNVRQGNENTGNFSRNYEQATELLKKARLCFMRNDYEQAKTLALEADGKVSTAPSKSLLKEINEAIRKSNVTSRRVENIIYPTKQRQAEMLIHKVEEDICKGNLNEAKVLLNSAEQLRPSERTKALGKCINELEDIQASTSSSDNVHSYQLTQDNTALSNQQESKECVEIAQGAYNNGNYDKAERMLLKSLRICKSQKVEEFLQLVRDERAQKSKTIPPTSTDPDVKILNQDQSLHETWQEYEKCLEIAKEASFKKDYGKAERFLEKAIRFHATDEANASLQKIKLVIADEIIIKQAEERERLKQEKNVKEAELYMDLALKAVCKNDYYRAKRHVDRAIELQPTKKNIELLEDIEANLNEQHHNKNKPDPKSVANSYLKKAKQYIDKGNLNVAEVYLQESMERRQTKNTFNVCKDYLAARLAQIRHEVDDKRRNSKDLRGNEYQAYQMVSEALDTFRNGHFEKAEKLLMTAHDTYQTVYVGHLLIEVRKVRDKIGSGWISKIPSCSIC